MHDKTPEINVGTIPRYDHLRYFLKLIDGIEVSVYESMTKNIKSHTGTPQDTVDWSDQESWIPQLLSGEELKLANYLYQESDGTLELRYLEEHMDRLINIHNLVKKNQYFEVTDSGQQFLNNPLGEIEQCIDYQEGVLHLLDIIGENGPGKRSDFMPSFVEILEKYSNYEKESVFNHCWKHRARNLYARDLINKSGFTYEITEKGLSYLEEARDLLMQSGKKSAYQDRNQVRIKDQSHESDKPDTYSLDDLSRATYLDRNFWLEIQFLLKNKQQIVLYGPPGTGKTKVAQEFARYWVNNAENPSGETRIIQFHPSYSYEEFMEGIRPETQVDTEGDSNLVYRVRRGIFRKFCEDARQHPNQRYVLIIDEINRGELSRIFGELMYLLEYRDQQVKLPYSGESFAIPQNIYVIGTMNTADRSIAVLDHALRRRFHFVAMKPNPEVLRKFWQEKNDQYTWLGDLLKYLNTQLDQRDQIEWHLHIGHSHFMTHPMDDETLNLIWQYSIMPLLEEYFYRQQDRLEAYELDLIRDKLESDANNA